MGGRCVRLTHGRFEALTAYSDDPVEVAASFERVGVERLHVVDLDGARTGVPAHRDTLRLIKEQTNLVVDYGGGIRSGTAVEDAFDAGADMLSIGSVAVSDPDLLGSWITTFGATRFIFAADVRDGLVTVSGWTETTSLDVETAIERAADAGVTSVLVTDISVDGTLKGPSGPLYRRLRARFPDIHLIASGGVGSVEDIDLLRETGVDAVIVGKAIYEGRLDLSQLV